MTIDYLELLAAQIQSDYDEKMAAIDLLRGISPDGGSTIKRRGRKPAEAQPIDRPVSVKALEILDEQETVARSTRKRGAYGDKTEFDHRLDREMALKHVHQKAKGKKRAARGSMTTEEKKAKAREYAKAWYAKNKKAKPAKRKSRPLSEDRVGEDGLPPEEFKQFLEDSPAQPA